MSKSSAIQERTLYFLIPTLSIVILLLSGFLEGSSQAEDSMRLFLSALALVALLWWLLSTCYLFFLIRHYGRKAVLKKTPTVPKFIRNTVFALCGLNILSNPALAAEVSLDQIPASSISVIVGKRDQPPISPFFSFPENNLKNSHKASISKTDETNIKIEKVRQKTYQQLSPFFQGEETARHSQVKTNNRTYVIQAGDTLWDIAALKIGSDNPTEIIPYLMKILEVNSETIEDIDSLIYPGQIINLP